MTNWFKTFFHPAPAPAADEFFDHPDIARMSRRELADLPLYRPSAPKPRERKVQPRLGAACPTL